MSKPTNPTESDARRRSSSVCSPLFGEYGPKDWKEDSGHENGDYQNRCCQCDAIFLGHKRRVVCKECSDENEAARNAMSEPERHNALASMKRAIDEQLKSFRANAESSDA